MPTTVNLGRVQPIYKGAYDSGEVYTPLDFVTYNGASYFCILTTTAGTLPTNTTYWQIVASGSIALDAHKTSDDHDNRYGDVQQQLNIELGRDYDSGSQINVYRIGRQVTIWWNGTLTFPDQNTIRSDEVIPAWALSESAGADYVVDVRGGTSGGSFDGTARLIQRIRVVPNGEFQVLQTKTDSSTTCTPTAVSYIAAD